MSSDHFPKGDALPPNERASSTELREVLRMINEWLRFAEGKNAALLTLSMGAVAAWRAVGEGACPSVAAGLHWAFIVLMLFSACCCLVSFFPSLSESRLLRKRRGEGRGANPLNVVAIASLTADEYASQIKGMLSTGKELSPWDRAYVDQIKANATIAAFKFECFKCGVTLAAIGLAVLTLLLLIGA